MVINFTSIYYKSQGFPGGVVVKNVPTNTGDIVGNGNRLQYCCLENFMSDKYGRLQSMGSRRVGNTRMRAHTHTLTVIYINLKTRRDFRIYSHIHHFLRSISYNRFAIKSI